MYYKTFSERLRRAGWVIIDDSRDDRHVIEITTDSNKDGTPGKIRQVWQGGRRVRI